MRIHNAGFQAGMDVVHAVALTVVAMVACTSIVSAEDVVVHAPTTVAVGGLYTYLEPFIMAIFTALLGVLTATAAAFFKKRTGLDVDRQAVDRLNLACANAAGRLLASQESTFAHATIDVRSPLIAQELPKVLAYAADSVQALGWTPDHVADTILAKVGQLQAQALGGTVLDKPAPTPK